MPRFIIRWTINALAIALAVYFVPGIDLGGSLPRGNVFGGYCDGQRIYKYCRIRDWVN